MRKGSLANYFESFAAKRLSPVEADAMRSNQHEFNGIKEFKEMFGLNRRDFSSKILYLSDDENDFVSSACTMTWYDAREKHPARTEHRLYYQSDNVFDITRENDFLLICKIKDKEELLVAVVEANSSAENQIRWLFNISDDEIDNKVDYKNIDADTGRLSFVGAYILEQIGVDVSERFVEESKLELLLKEFPNGFPSTKIFSAFARNDLSASLSDVTPDNVILMWMEHEEVLFRTLEKHLIDQRLKDGFQDSDDFIAFSLSVQNRRKSRAGHAFENHLIQIFTDLNIRFSHNKRTENKSRPDFIFPGIGEYHTPSFSEDLLYMLAVKTSCKDRWRQVLTEAKRINNKHLITLEPSISSDQTDEMFSHQLKLVIPVSIQATYKPEQQQQLLTLNNFIEIVN